ncbi:excisionase family DNA-binding protein [Corynebacterium glucuronolyticum]|uniref:excisionase family DNA-binding protein n=1 Tax=Corynebacterium glucuronolyticum TaxID=39791 RepID=UPI00019C215A|nr:DNA binding domain, excisionase family [Corynebacterium glucuronolyticum ATCC 51867]QRO81960.1 excisionase family DNA-binding protein [Corynebacterium glucuronolyticum]
MPKTATNPAIELEKFVTYQEAAERLSVTTRTLRKWVQDRRIRAYRPYPGSRCVRFKVRELNELMEVA